MRTGVILPDILAFHALARLALVLVFPVRHGDPEKLFDQLVVDTLAMLYAHAGKVQLFGTAHDLREILVGNVRKSTSYSLNLLHASRAIIERDTLFLLYSFEVSNDAVV